MDDLDLGTTLKGFLPGQKVLGRYSLVKLLGRGGMGVVWLARDEELERQVALKFLPEVVALDAEAVADLKRETRRNLELTHPHIVRIHDFVSDKRTAAISMEFVDGSTLSALKLEAPDRRLPVERLKPWVAQWLDAMHYAHTKAKVVHRDLKPANLMVTGEGDLKVTDFGIASSITDSVSRVSKQAGSSGTPIYMSPQQMMGEKPAVTDDIYAVGATLFELLTGKPPFHTGNILMQVQSKPAPRLSERLAELGAASVPVDREWEATIAACLAKNPGERPQSAAAVAESLGLAARPGRTGGDPARKVDAGRAVEPGARTDSSPPASSRSGGPSFTASAKAMVAAAIVAVAGLGWYVGLHLPEQRRIEAARIESARIEAERIEAERLRVEAADRIDAERRRVEAAALREAEQRRDAERAQAVREAAERTVREERARLAAFNRIIRIDGLGLVLQPIPAGTFDWGSERPDATMERPITTVTHSRPFWMGRTEVTQAQWRLVMGSDPAYFKGDNLPVERVTFDEAIMFCRALTDRERVAGRLPEGYHYWLPQEAQWEYACRAGTTGDYSGELAAMAWYGREIDGTREVGRKEANAWGLHDMHGNVWEWCADLAGAYPGGRVTDPRGPADSQYRTARIVRGGAWWYSAEYCRSASRNKRDQNLRSSSVGFRVALVPSS